MTIAVAVKGVGLDYGETPVVGEVSMDIRAGEFFVIIGPNGAGKTSLLKLIAGIIRPNRGGISVFGRDIGGCSRKELARQVAMVPQEVVLDFPFTVAETVLMGRSPHLGLLELEREEDYQLAARAMGFTDITHLAGRRLNHLSGGERQRVIIARAICQQPRVILLDEPTAALDLAHQMKVMDLMERFRREQGTTVIMVSHDLNLAAMYGDRLLLLKDGGVVCQGGPAEVLTHERLEAVYGCVVLVDENLPGKVPRVTPVPEKFLQDT